jgi:DNA-binding transcriptional MerR regulator
MSRLSIGTVADQAGVKVPTIRYYESIGLLKAAPRTDSNRRQYDQGDVQRLRFIRHARDMGFEVEAIRQLLDLSGRPEGDCATVDGIARQHLLDVDRKISQLQALRGELARMISECGHGRIGECRIMEVLADHALCHEDHR